MTSQTLAINIRPANTTDINFILKSYIKSFKGSFFTRNAPMDLFAPLANKKMKAKLNDSVVLIACSTENPSVIFGFIIYQKYDEGNVIHYVYTRESVRNFKIAKTLIGVAKEDKELLFYTHETNHARSIAESFNAKYHPLLYW